MGSKFIFISALCSVLLSQTNGAKILGLFPHPGKSHFEVFKVLMEDLVAKGHSVTVVSFFPQPHPPKGYVDISLVGLQPIFLHVVSFSDFGTSNYLEPYINFFQLSAMGLETCAAVLPSPQVQSLLNRRDFDLIIVEQFNTDCFLGIVHHMKTPFIGISSCALLPWLYRRIGVPDLPSVVPSIFSGKTTTMKFLDRLENTLFHTVSSILYYPMYERPAQQLVQRYIGRTPPLHEIAKNTSLILANTHFALHQPRPTTSNLIEVGGLHIRPAKKLPEDIESFLDGATDGVILFSFGSMLDPNTLPQEKQEAFVNVFANIRQRVLWKFSKSLQVSENVKILSWLPQRDILEHKNVKGFIAHGGLLGLTEAIHCGKPIIAVPIFGDQRHNVEAAVAAGVAIQISYPDINENSITKALQTILTDSYQTRAKELSKIFRNRPQEPRQLATFWVEYVLKHGGNPLKQISADLNILQYYCIDVYSTIFVFLLGLLLFFKKLFCFLVKAVSTMFKSKQKNQRVGRDKK